MAGSDQSVNLGGMLTGISDTIGGMSAAGAGLMPAIENMGRPNVDPNNPDDLQKLMQWQQKMGREDAARTTMGQISLLDKKRREDEAKAKEARELNIQKATMAAKARLATAISSGDVAAQQRESEILDKMGAQFGIDSSKIKSETEGTQLRLNRERDAAESKQTAEQINQVTATVIDQYGIDSPQFQKLKEVPMLQQNRDLVRAIESRELQLLNARERREEEALEKATPPDVSYVTSVISNPKIADAYPELQQQLEVITKRIDGREAGQWMVGEKRAVLRDIANLERNASRKLGAMEAAELADEKSYERARNSAAMYKPTNAEVEAYIKQNPKEDNWLWGTDVDFTYDEAVRELQEGRVQQVDGLYGKTGESVDGAEKEEEDDNKSGSVSNPYAPKSRGDYAKIPSGSYYIKNGTVMRKK